MSYHHTYYDYVSASNMSTREYATDEEIRRYCTIQEELNPTPKTVYNKKETKDTKEGININPVDQRIAELSPHLHSVRRRVLQELPFLEQKLLAKYKAEEERKLDMEEEIEFEARYLKEVRYEAYKQRRKMQLVNNQIHTADLIIGMNMQEVVAYFSNIKPLYFYPIMIDGVRLTTDGNFDNNRCNVIFEKNKVVDIKGWF